VTDSVGLTVAKPFLPTMRFAVDGGFALAKSAERPFLAASSGALREGVRLGGRLRVGSGGWCLPCRGALQQSPEEVLLHFGEILQIRKCQARLRLLRHSLEEVPLDVGEIFQVGEC